MWEAGMGGGGRFGGGNPDRLRQAFLDQDPEGLEQYRQRSIGALQGPAPRGFDPNFYGGMRDALYRLNLGQGHDPTAWINNGRGGPPMNDMLPPPPGGGQEFATGGGLRGGGLEAERYPGRRRKLQRDGVGGNLGIAQRRSGGFQGQGPGGYQGKPGGPYLGGMAPQKPQGGFSYGGADWQKLIGQGGPAMGVPGRPMPGGGPAMGPPSRGGAYQLPQIPGPQGGGPMSWPMGQAGGSGFDPASRPPGIYGIGPGGTSASGGAQTYDQWQRPNQAQWFKRTNGTSPEAFQAWQAATGR